MIWNSALGSNGWFNVITYVEFNFSGSEFSIPLKNWHAYREFVEFWGQMILDSVCCYSQCSHCLWQARDWLLLYLALAKISC